MSKMRTIIVDDEPLARRGLKIRLQDNPGIDLLAECENGREALQAIAELSPDLVFLDIQMPGMDGFDVVRKLQGDDMPLVVFVTAFDEYAVEAFRINAIDYVLKPIDDDRLAEAVDRAVEHHAQQALADHKRNLVNACMHLTGATEATVEEIAQGDGAAYPDKISIRDGDEAHLIPVADIDWVDAAGDYMCVHVDGVTHIMRITMKQLEALLNPAQFLRVHRSTIVNAARITSAQSIANGEFLLTLGNDSRVKVSRSYREKIRDLVALH
jgi:two-component system LytT family response regulator